LTATLGEAEVLFSAGDTVKGLAESGALAGLHERLADLNEASEGMYISTRDKLQNVIKAAEAKEDEIYESLKEDYDLTGIRMHGVFGMGP